MRELRFVRCTDDGRLVLESNDPVEELCLVVDAGVRAAVRASTAAPAFTPPPPAPPATPPATSAEPTLGPREIQMRVRAGESPEQVAESIGTSVERILRFAGPVVDERRRNADEARRARARRSTAEGQVVIFGEAVDERFAAHGIHASDVTWDSRRREDGEWVITAHWLGGAGAHTAEWLFHRTSRSVTPIDDTAADLLSDRPIRPVSPPEPEPERPSLAAAPPLVPGIVAFPPMPEAHTGPIPRVEDVFDQDAAPEGPRDIPPLVPAAASVDFDEVPLPLGITDPAQRPAALSRLSNRGAHKRDESDEERAARARVPSWDDILLGVRRKD